METIFDLSGQRLLYRLFAVMVIVAVHGFAVAGTARLMGDRGPQHDGRLGLNPLNHIEPIGALALVFFQFGWIKPLAVDPARLRGGKWGLFAVVLGSLLAMLVLAALLWLLRPFVVDTIDSPVIAVTLTGLFETTASMAIQFAVFNLIPIPPLTAGLLLAGFAPAVHKRVVSRLIIPAALLGVLVVTGIPGQVLAWPIAALSELVLI